jgi:glycosyltransferase involved in cell wall biosynthesis
MSVNLVNKHILMTANAAWNIWNFRRPIVEALLRDGHKITVLAPADMAVPNLLSLGCRFLPIEMNTRSLNPFQGIKLQQVFKRFFQEENPDIILSYTIKNNIFGSRAARALGIRFIPNVTGLGTAFLSGMFLQKITEQLYYEAFRSVPTVFFQNQDDQDLFLKRGIVRSKQARLLPGSGVDLERFAPAELACPEVPPIILMVSRILGDKGVLEFVDAARQVKVVYPRARFQLLGATVGSIRNGIDKNTVEEWVLEGVVEYLGETNDVRTAISASSCIVLPSYREGAPRSLMEAAAMARPIITTDVPGCRSVIDHNVSGFLCHAKSASSLAEAILLFLGLSPKQKKDMGDAGRMKMVAEFDQTLIVEAYRNIVSSSDN